VRGTGLRWAKVEEMYTGKLNTLLHSLLNSSGSQERKEARNTESE